MCLPAWHWGSVGQVLGPGSTGPLLELHLVLGGPLEVVPSHLEGSSEPAQNADQIYPKLPTLKQKGE